MRGIEHDERAVFLLTGSGFGGQGFRARLRFLEF